MEIKMKRQSNLVKSEKYINYPRASCCHVLPLSPFADDFSDDEEPCEVAPH